MLKFSGLVRSQLLCVECTTVYGFPHHNQTTDLIYVFRIRRDYNLEQVIRRYGRTELCIELLVTAVSTAYSSVMSYASPEEFRTPILC